MPNQAFEIQPLLPPTLTTAPGQYSEYLQSYKLYVSTVQEIREAATAKVKAAKTSSKPPPKPKQRVPIELKEKIGEAFSKGQKFGSLTFSAEELSAARKRWEVLCKRRRSRASVPLTEPQFNEFMRLKNMKAKIDHAENGIDFYESSVVPLLADLQRQSGVYLGFQSVSTLKNFDKNSYPKAFASDVLGHKPAFRPEELTGLKEKFAAGVRRKFQFTVDALESLERGQRAVIDELNVEQRRAAIVKAKAEASLLQAEATLKAAQTKTQLNRSSLKRTVVNSTRGSISGDGDRARLVMIPEVTETVESLMESSASEIKADQLSVALPKSYRLLDVAAPAPRLGS